MYPKNSKFKKEKWIKRGYSEFLNTYINHNIYSKLPKEKREKQIEADWHELTGVKASKEIKETKKLKSKTFD